jgi:hypothetical protein
MSKHSYSIAVLCRHRCLRHVGIPWSLVVVYVRVAAALLVSRMLTIPLLTSAVCCRQSCAADCPMLPAGSSRSLSVVETIVALFLCRLVVSRPLDCGVQSRVSPAVVVDGGAAGAEPGG